MKTSMTKFLTLCGVALLILQACKKDGVQVVAGTTTPGALTATSTTLVLSSASLTDATQVMGFSFTQPTYGYSAAVTNTLQIDAVADNWANPYTVALSTNVLKQGFNTSDFNNILLKLGLRGGVAGQVNVRIMSSIGTSVAPTYSNVVGLTVTPFNLKSWLYAVGAFQTPQWTLSVADSLYSATSNGIYVGVINFTAGNNQFLILPKKTTYDNKYATTDAQGSTSKTVTVGGSNNFYAPSAAGQYLVTLNINTNTISFAAVDYYSVIGDAAQGWGTDVPMKYVNDGSGNWAVTLPLVSTGAFKVRRNFDWTNSWGIPKSGSAGFGVAATLNNSTNDNITVTPSGTYKVTFNAPASLINSVALATTTYTAVKQ